MAEHNITLDYIDGWVAVCSCGRWHSKPYQGRGDADDAGMAHVVRGDDHNRAIAQFQRGQTRVDLKSELRWYEEQAENLLNSSEERELWKTLADDLRPRVSVRDDSIGQDPLW